MKEDEFDFLAENTFGNPTFFSNFSRFGYPKGQTKPVHIINPKETPKEVSPKTRKDCSTDATRFSSEHVFFLVVQGSLMFLISHKKRLGGAQF